MRGTESVEAPASAGRMPKVCARCGAAFQSRTPNAKYCGAECRRAVNLARKAKNGRGKAAKQLDRYVVVNRAAAEEIALAREETRRRAGW